MVERTPKSIHAERVAATLASDNEAARSSIAASWARSSFRYGLIPDDDVRKRRYGARELTERREVMERMMRVSQAPMDRLHRSLDLVGCSVFLCDADGIIVDHRTSENERADYEAAGLANGADWSESVQGTNGIGTCVAEARPVSIFRDQHFRSENIEMSCAGAPVFDERGALAAVLDVSSCRGGVGAALARLVGRAVEDAARQIEADHFEDYYADARIVRGRGDGSSGAVLFAVDADDLLIGATRAARRAYRLGPELEAGAIAAADVLGDADRRGGGREGAERRELRRAIARARGNMSEAARLLGVSRATLYRRARKLGLSV